MNEETGRATVKKIEELYGAKSAIFVKVDVSKEDQIKNAVDVAEKEFGNTTIVDPNRNPVIQIWSLLS